MKKRILWWLAVAVLSGGDVLVASSAPKATWTSPPLLIGSAWYPEQWPEARWDADLSLMHDAGLNVVRIGEFAWSSLEPAEGKYELDWMDRAIAAAGRHGIAVVIGTPTDAPPAWLTAKYPETLRIDADGKQMQHGSRRQFSYASVKYREFCRDIVEQLARRFGHTPDVIAWQIGNELTEDSYDPDARRQFHAWLQAKYGSLEELNRRWATAYWSQAYDSWDEIPMDSQKGNPGLLLDYKHFVTDTWLSFQRNQIDVLRKYVEPRERITTNLGGWGWADRFDRRKIAGDYDFISWDEYVGQGHLDAGRMGATHDLVRGWKHRNFWVMEMQPGFVDWAPVSNSLDPGETRAMVWEAIGHGADATLFWQWRAAPNGQEQYHGTLVGADGMPVPIYAEVRRTAQEMAQASTAIEGTEPESEIAILHDYDSRWAIDFHPQTQRYDQIDVLLGYYRAFRDLAQSVDIVDPTDPACSLSHYKLVLAPSLNVIPEELGKKLQAYVAGGGHLVLGPRSGMKDAFNALDPRRQPGPLLPVLGARVDQFYALLDDAAVSGPWGMGKATIWAEVLQGDEAAVGGEPVHALLRYGRGNGWLEGRPAAVERPFGQGSIAYVGAVLDANAMRSVAVGFLTEAGIENSAHPNAHRRTLNVPTGVEVCRRVGDGREVFILINHRPVMETVILPAQFHDALHENRPSSFVDLETNGVAVLWRTTLSAPKR